MPKIVPGSDDNSQYGVEDCQGTKPIDLGDASVRFESRGNEAARSRCRTSANHVETGRTDGAFEARPCQVTEEKMERRERQIQRLRVAGMVRVH